MELTKSEIQRYKRHLLLHEIGEQGQELLKNSHVLVIGAGGLANAVLPYLAAAGVGEITVVDQDVVDLSNLQRQVLFTENDLGKPKSKVATERLKALNSNGTYHSITKHLTLDNAIELSANKDIIIDCVDQIDVRYLINDISVHHQIPMVYGALHKFEGQVSVFNYNNGATYRCAFPENKKKTPSPNCEESGVIGVLPGIIGMYQALETIKIITKSGKVLANQIMMIDLMNNVNQIINVDRNKESVIVATNRINDLRSKKSISSIVNINGSELIDVISTNPDLLIIDIQDKPSYKKLAGKEVSHIPFRVFLDGVKDIPTSKPVLVFCAHGINSQWATAVLKDKKIEKIYHLVGGISAI